MNTRTSLPRSKNTLGLSAPSRRGAVTPSPAIQRGLAIIENFRSDRPITAAASPPRPPTNYRLQGIAAALGALAREHMEPELAAMVLDSLGLPVADLKAAGADPYNLEPLMTFAARYWR